MLPIKVLFVCLGNICRSPLAEGIFKDLAVKAGLDSYLMADSAGTSNYHIGENPDARTLRNAKKNGLTLNHRGRQFGKADFDRFDHIVVMDQQNLKDVLNLSTQSQHHSKVKLLRQWDMGFENQDVPDPWFGGEEGFETVFQIIQRSTTALFDDLKRKN